MKLCADGDGPPHQFGAAAANLSASWKMPALLTEFNDCPAFLSAEQHSIGHSFCAKHRPPGVPFA